MDYEVERCTRHCAASQRELREGEEFFSVLLSQRGDVRRHDYAADAWTGPPEAALAWWKSRLPTREAKKGELAPNDVLLRLFQGLETVPQQLDMRYVLALLLVRRRVLREDDTEIDTSGREVLVLNCPRDETIHRVVVTMPDERRTEQIQTELGRLLLTGAAEETMINETGPNETTLDRNMPDRAAPHCEELA